MTIKDRMQLINLATKGLDGAVKTHLTEKNQRIFMDTQTMHQNSYQAPNHAA